MFSNRKLRVEVTVARKNPFTYVSDGVRQCDSHVLFSWECRIPRHTPTGDVARLLQLGHEFVTAQVEKYQTREEMVPPSK
jgi:hypothetical protein